jgi:hypothetical protein
MVTMMLLLLLKTYILAKIEMIMVMVVSYKDVLVQLLLLLSVVVEEVEAVVLGRKSNLTIRFCVCGYERGMNEALALLGTARGERDGWWKGGYCGSSGGGIEF